MFHNINNLISCILVHKLFMLNEIELINRDIKFTYFLRGIINSCKLFLIEYWIRN